MQFFKRLLSLVLLVLLFCILLLFVVSNGKPASVDLLVSGWQFQVTQGVLLLLTLVVGVVIGVVLQWSWQKPTSPSEENSR